MDMASILFIIFMLFLNTLLLFIQLKGFQIAIIMLHSLIMVFTLYVGIAIAFPFNAMFGLFVSIYGIITLIINILKTEA